MTQRDAMTEDAWWEEQAASRGVLLVQWDQHGPTVKP